MTLTQQNPAEPTAQYHPSMPLRCFDPTSDSVERPRPARGRLGAVVDRCLGFLAAIGRHRCDGDPCARCQAKRLMEMVVIGTRAARLKAVVLCPDCGKQTAFRGRCPKCNSRAPIVLPKRSDAP